MLCKLPTLDYTSFHIDTLVDPWGHTGAQSGILSCVFLCPDQHTHANIAATLLQQDDATNETILLAD